MKNSVAKIKEITTAIAKFFSVRRRGSYLRSSEGAVAMVFALSVPMFVAAAGMTVDLAQAYNVKNRLGHALDKAALAAGSMTGDIDEIKIGVEKFIEANYSGEKLGTPFDIEVEMGDGTVRVSASARVDTVFMRILGQDYLEVSQETIVRRELAGVEAVLVLDVTGSMAGTNITTLRQASRSFINTMFSRISDLEYLKIGIVPFSQSVNVGSYGLGIDLTGGAYDTAFVNRPSSDPYVTPASNIQYSSATSTVHWTGCILERAYPRDTNDDASPNWGMYRYPRICSSYNSNGTCRTYSNNNPNNRCPTSRVVPLTNNRALLEGTIDGLQAVGNTYINVGAVWGWRVVSPEAPFTEGMSYDHPDWSKAVIIMTDGNNEPVSTYSAYGANPSGITATTLNNRLLEVCTGMKAQGIKVYTITFQSGISNSTKNLFRSCATDATKYFDAPSNQSLVDAFEQIANQLSQLHIVK